MADDYGLPHHILLSRLQSRQNLILQRIAQLESNLYPTTHRSEPASDQLDVDNPGALGLKRSQTRNVEESLSRFLHERGVTSFKFARVPSNYYSRTYAERRDILGAASIHHLCKSIVMVNSQVHESVKDCTDRNNSKYYVIVIQYVARLHAEKVKKFIYSLNRGKFPKTKFNMRLAPESDSCNLTGYEHNAVTPLNMRTNIPVILSEKILKLEPNFLWLGGGEVDLKLGMRVQDFMDLVNPFIVDCTYPDNDQ
ncbi:hypothetical protein O6H91_06G096400 [Diphasiastrum complanatum]|uniref:Uncharacterized protein n=1 Tax=Diphasiastrum complanatum TaxID=34168 RepID=A0ACC2DGL4_DIPCM|nr:hypothetical protein O6H91_06G096400 [Diphasiastrum complanatum]